MDINLKETGGIAVVILNGLDMPTDYAYHPQILPLIATGLPDEREELSRVIPATTKIVLIGGELQSGQFGMLRTVLSQRNLTFVQRRNQPALLDAMRSILPLAAPPKPSGNGNGKVIEAKKPPQAKGSVSALVQECADLSKGSAEEARRLMRIATERGIATTVNSLAQAVSVAKRKGGRTETPRSIMTAQQRALTTLDEAIAGLQLIREYVADTERLNLELTEKLDKFKAILK